MEISREIILWKISDVKTGTSIELFTEELGETKLDFGIYLTNVVEHLQQLIFVLILTIGDSDIRHLTSTSVIPISEEYMWDWTLSFQYRKSSDIDIWAHSDTRYTKNILFTKPLFSQVSALLLSHHVEL